MRWDTAFWDNETFSGVPRRDRRSGPYRRCLPDRLVGAPLTLSQRIDEQVALAERSVRELQGSMRDLAGISRFLLRSEAIASSRIEGVAPSSRQVALAELGQSEDVAGVSQQARLVANNMTVVREATTRLVDVPRIEVTHIADLHRALLPDEPRHHGVRTVQNWIGGSDHHPLDADFVPPPAEMVPDLLEDLCGYLAGAVHSPLVQAALVHAQFETIHPFTDGNGRVGRALIHTVLARRGLTADAVLPVSLVLSTLREGYIAGLTAFRADADEAHPGTGQARWVGVFAEATIEACRQARLISTELTQVRAEWVARLADRRGSRGAQRALRRDSATALVLGDLPATPVLTVATVERIHGVSRTAAAAALDELEAAGILERRSVGPQRQAYLAPQVLDLIPWAEPRLASSRFDTRHSPPVRPAPAPPGAP